MEAMTIAIGGETVLPLACVVESLSVGSEELHAARAWRHAARATNTCPCCTWASCSRRSSRVSSRGIAVIVETDGSKAALLVDELVGQQQVVVKSLETNFRKVPGLSGATVMETARSR